jgi:O-antigen/teichoic acid export membrane protein
MHLINLIKKNEFTTNVLKLMTGTALGQLITVLVAPILARIYTPEDFGILAIYISVVAILAVVICLRFELAIILPSEDKEAVDLVILGISIAFGFSFLILIVFSLFNILIADFIGHPELGFYLYLVPLSTFFYGSFQVLSYWMSRIQRFSQLAIAKTTKEAAIAGTQLTLGSILNIHAFGLIAGQITGNAVAATILFIKSFQHISKGITAGLLPNLKAVFIKYKKFPLFTSWAAFLNAISQNIPTILLAFLFSPAVAGFYAIAIRVLGLPAALIGNSVKQVYFQKASSLYNNEESTKRFFIQTTRQLTLIAALPILIVIIWGEPLFLFVFGSEWGEAGRYAAILSFWLFFSFVNPPSMVSIYLLKLNKIHLFWEALLLIFRVSSILLAYILFNDVIIAITLYTVVGVLFNTFLIGLIYHQLNRLESKQS